MRHGDHATVARVTSAASLGILMKLARALLTLGLASLSAGLVCRDATAHAEGPPPVSRGVRIGLEALGGYVGAGLLGGAGFGIGLAVRGDPWVAVFAGSGAGAIGVPTGIYLTGELLGGDGNYWATWGGVLAGSVIPFAVSYACLGHDNRDGIQIALWATLPVAGGVLFYELFQSHHGAHAAPPPVTVGLGPSERGGFVLSLGGSL